MAVLLGFEGHRFDDAVPLFCTAPGLLAWHRGLNKIVDMREYNARAADAGYSWQPGEVGVPPVWWQNANNVGLDFGSGGSGGPDPTPPIVFEVDYSDWPGRMTGNVYWNIHINDVDHDGVEVVHNDRRLSIVNRITAALNELQGVVAQNVRQNHKILATPETGYTITKFVVGFDPAEEDEDG